MKSSPPDWIDLCKPCKDGVCKYVNNLINAGVVDTVKGATDFMSHQVGGEWKGETLRRIYYRGKPRVTIVTDPKEITEEYSSKLRRWALESLSDIHEAIGLIVMNIFLNGGCDLDEVGPLIKKCQGTLNLIVRQLKKVQSGGFTA